MSRKKKNRKESPSGYNTKHERRESRRKNKEKKENLHAHRKIIDPENLICPWCLKNSNNPAELKNKNTTCALWPKARKELGNWAIGTIMCDTHQTRIYPDLWFETLRIILDSMESLDSAERNRIYYLERDKFQSIRSIIIKEAQERENMVE